MALFQDDKEAHAAPFSQLFELLSADPLNKIQPTHEPVLMDLKKEGTE